MQTLIALFGQGKDLAAAQMCARAVVVSILTVMMMRISGRRSLGQRNPYDSVVPILLGAIVSRAVVGASPFVPTMLAGLAIVLVHRLASLLSLSFPAFERIINGNERVVARCGMIDPVQMKKGLLTERDLVESARMHGCTDISDADVVFERSGEISFIRQTPKEPSEPQHGGNPAAAGLKQAPWSQAGYRW